NCRCDLTPSELENGIPTLAVAIDPRANIMSVYGRRQMQYGERERPGPRNRIAPGGSGRSRSPYCTVHPCDNRSKKKIHPRSHTKWHEEWEKRPGSPLRASLCDFVDESFS